MLLLGPQPVKQPGVPVAVELGRRAIRYRKSATTLARRILPRTLLAARDLKLSELRGILGVAAVVVEGLCGEDLTAAFVGLLGQHRVLPARLAEGDVHEAVGPDVLAEVAPDGTAVGAEGALGATVGDLVADTHRFSSGRHFFGNALLGWTIIFFLFILRFFVAFLVVGPFNRRTV